MKSLWSLTVLFTFWSCSSSNVASLQRQDTVSQAQSRSLVVQYFHPPVPNWASFSQVGRCMRNPRIRYLDYEKLRSSFRLSYRDTAFFQYTFNQLYSELLRDSPTKFLLQKQEDTLFYNAQDRVKSGFVPFRLPTYKRVNLVWVDSYLKSQKGRKELINLMLSKKIEDGHPIWMSLCLTQKDLLAKQSELGFSDLDIRFLPAELFSLDDFEGKRRFFFNIHIRSFLEGKEIDYYSYDKEVPENFMGFR